MNRRVRRRAGFTLIEVLLVLVILVILAGVIVGNLGGAQAKANARAARVTVGSLEQAVNMYHLDLNNYPASLEALVQAPGDLPNPAKWGGPYLEKGLPVDPWDQPFNYSFPGQRSPKFDIWSSGPDGVSGSEDDIGNWST